MEKIGNNSENNRPGGRNVRSEREDRLRIGISQGDGSTWQYEAIARLFADNSIFDTALPFVYGSAPLLTAAGKNIGLHDLNPLVQRQIQDVKGKRLQVFNPEYDRPEDMDTTMEDTYSLLQAAVTHLKDGQVRALVSLPVSEEAVRQRHADFKNQAMTVAQVFPGTPFRMLLCGSLRLSFLTTVRREDSEAYLSRQRIEQRISELCAALKSDFAITTPRIAVLGMNKDLQADRLTLPDTQVIKPVVTGLFENGIPVFGPYSARAFFSQPDRYAFDAILCMYKEQMEMVFDTCSKEESCYYTASLPIVHVEPVLPGSDREAAFHSLFRSVCMAIDIDAARQQYRKLTEDPVGYAMASHRDHREEESPEKILDRENQQGGHAGGKNSRNPRSGNSE